MKAGLAQQAAINIAAAVPLRPILVPAMRGAGVLMNYEVTQIHLALPIRNTRNIGREARALVKVTTDVGWNARSCQKEVRAGKRVDLSRGTEAAAVRTATETKDKQNVRAFLADCDTVNPVEHTLSCLSKALTQSATQKTRLTINGREICERLNGSYGRG